MHPTLMFDREKNVSNLLEVIYIFKSTSLSF